MLYLLPNVLDESLDHRLFFPKTVDEAVFEIEGIIAENEKNARVFLKRFAFSRDRTFREIPIKLLSEHTKDVELKELLELLKKGEKWGLISDCGLPCLADPGSALVSLAHRAGIEVKTFVGPSSIIMALQLSGLFCQNFSFQGYLPREEPLLLQKLKALEIEAFNKGFVQAFIEAPYRNQKLLESLIQNLPKSMKLCVACDLTLPTQKVTTLSIEQWKKQDLSYYQKKPVVFVLGC